MGKYIKLFNNHNEYQQFLGQPSCDGTYSIITPNISYCEEENETHYNPSTGFTGYKTGLTTEQDVIAYVKEYVNRPRADLIYEYTNIYPDCGSLKYIGATEEDWWLTCWNDVVDNFPCTGEADSPCGSGDGASAIYYDGPWQDEAYWQVGWGGFMAFYYPNDGHVCVRFYDD